MLWCDESMFELFAYTIRVVSLPPTYLSHNSTILHGGGKLQVWACMAANDEGSH